MARSGSGGLRGRGGISGSLALHFVRASETDHVSNGVGNTTPVKQNHNSVTRSVQGIHFSSSNMRSIAGRRSNFQPAARNKPTGSFPRAPEAKPVLTKESYMAAWQTEKDQRLWKFRKLAYEVVALKTDRPNAIDKVHSAANRVPVRVEFNTEPLFSDRNNNHFLCYVFVDGATVGSGKGIKIKDAKVNAFEIALQKLLMPYLRIKQIDPESCELEASKEPFIGLPPEPATTPLPKSEAQIPPSVLGTTPKNKFPQEVASQHKESNLEAASLKRRIDELKPLEDFVIVEPAIPVPDCTSAHTLRRSADFNHMLLEYEYFFKGEAARCVLKIEKQTLADVNGPSKVIAKNLAATQALKKLKEICWVIKTKQAVDSDTKISKGELLQELSTHSDTVVSDGIGGHLMRKMGWSGGGLGKDNSGICEEIALKSVLNREGLGLSSQNGVTSEFKRRIQEVIESYAVSGNPEDLVFSYDFRMDERQVIYDECRKLNLKAKCRGKGKKRYICVRRKRSANQLFDHIMSSGGETARYILLPPGADSGGGHLPAPQSATDVNSSLDSGYKWRVHSSSVSMNRAGPGQPSTLLVQGSNVAGLTHNADSYSRNLPMNNNSSQMLFSPRSAVQRRFDPLTGIDYSGANFKSWYEKARYEQGHGWNRSGSEIYDWNQPAGNSFSKSGLAPNVADCGKLPRQHESANNIQNNFRLQEVGLFSEHSGVQNGVYNLDINASEDTVMRESNRRHNECNNRSDFRRFSYGNNSRGSTEIFGKRSTASSNCNERFIFRNGHGQIRQDMRSSVLAPSAGPPETGTRFAGNRTTQGPLHMNPYPADNYKHDWGAENNFHPPTGGSWQNARLGYYR